MNKAKKVVASGVRVVKIGCMYSRAALSLCGKYLIEGEASNPESKTRKALLTLKHRVTGKIIGNIIYIIDY